MPNLRIGDFWVIHQQNYQATWAQPESDFGAIAADGSAGGEPSMYQQFHLRRPDCWWKTLPELAPQRKKQNGKGRNGASRGHIPGRVVVLDNDADFESFYFPTDVTFSDACFVGRANFRNASFAGEANFNNASFAEWTDFGSVSFQNTADFSASSDTPSHKGSIFFAGATFKLAPSFFERQLHEDTDWQGVKWPGPSSKERVGDDVRRYERLSLMMSRLENMMKCTHSSACLCEQKKFAMAAGALPPL